MKPEAVIRKAFKNYEDIVIQRVSPDERIINFFDIHTSTYEAVLVVTEEEPQQEFNLQDLSTLPTVIHVCITNDKECYKRTYTILQLLAYSECRVVDNKIIFRVPKVEFPKEYGGKF